MKKKILMMLLSVVLIFSMMPMGVYADSNAEQDVEFVVSSKTDSMTIGKSQEAEFSVSMGAVKSLQTLEFKLTLSSGLTLVSDSVKMISAAELGMSELAFTPQTMLINGYGVGKYSSEKATTIMTFKCKVAEGATVGEQEVKLSDFSNADDEYQTIESHSTTKKITLVSEISSKTTLTGTLTTPTKGGTNESALSGENVNAQVTWSPELTDNKFAANTAYTATITVTPKQYYSFGNGASVDFGGLTFKKSGENFVATKKFGTTASRSITKLEVTTQPTKKNYTHGDNFDAVGMVVKATYDDQTVDSNFNKYTVAYQTEGKQYLKKGDTKVTLKAEGKSVEINGLSVEARELQIEGLKATNRKYDATMNVALTGGNLTGIVDGEEVSVAMPRNGMITDANVGTGKPVTVTEPDLTGKDAKNYTLKNITGIKVNITEADIPDEVVQAITGYSGQYDNAAHDAVVKGEAAKDYTLTFADAKDNAYSAAIPKVTNVADSKTLWVKITKQNYNDKIISVKAQVAPKTLTAAELEYSGTITKEYDGTTTCNVKTVTAKKESVFNQDVTVSGTAVYNKKGTDATKVTFTADGITEGNYRLAKGTSLDINASITATDKYSTDAEKYHTQNVVKGIGTFEEPEFISEFKEVVAGTFKFTYNTQETTKEAIINDLKDKNAGETASIGYTFTPRDVNYTGTKTGNITVKMIDIEFKVGDETASVDNAVTVKNDAPVYGTKWVDIIALKNNVSAKVGDKKVDGTYKLSVEPNTTPNAGTATYNILFTSKDGQYNNVKVFTTDASVTVAQRPLTIIGAKATDRQYDNTTTVVVTGGTLQGIVGKDDVDLGGNVTGTIVDANAGAKKAVTVSGYTISGAKAENYTLSQPTDVTVNIAKKELTLASATAANKTFDGTTKTNVTAVTFTEETPLPAAEGYAATAEFVDVNVGTGKTVTVKVVLNDKNYNLAKNTIETKADITKAGAATIPTQQVILKAGTSAEQIVDLAKLMPKNAGELVCTAQPNTTGDTIVDTEKAKVENGIYKFALKEDAQSEKTQTIKITIKSDNYEDTEVTIEVKTTAKEVPTVKVNDITVAYGTEVTKELIKGTANVNGTVVKGTFDWKAGVTAPTTVAQSGNYEVTFTPEETDKYEAVTKTIKVTITPANVTGTLQFGKATAGSTLGDITPADLTALTPSAGTFAWNDGDAQSIEQGKAYGWTFTPNDSNYAVLSGTVTPWASSGGGGGGGFVIPTDTPEKVAKDFIKNSLTINGAVVKAADADNYTKVLEAAEKYNKLSAAEKAAVDKEMKAQTGKTMAELKAEAEAIKASIGDSSFDVQKAVKELTLKARSAKLKSGSIKITIKGDVSEIEKNGYTVKYKFYRSTKKAKGYKAAVTKDVPNYLNTAGKKGTMYYYKARVMVYDKDGNLVAKTELKQCKYANRKWTKK